MKAIRINTNEFKPVTVQITFETEEELRAYANVVGWNVSIPSDIKKAIELINYTDVDLFMEVNNQIRSALLGTY